LVDALCKATLSAAHKTLLASLPDLAVLLVLSTVVRLARIAALGVIPKTGSHRKVLLPILAIADHTRQAVACREPWIRLPDDFARTFPPGFFD
jgi:hypothetical protein